MKTVHVQKYAVTTPWIKFDIASAVGPINNIHLINEIANITHFQSDANPIKKISSLTEIWLLSRYIITNFARL
jgi:hypothetical protein